ncbi:prepilin-type N-terminal cleavage/methylation domain-containing protein [Psychrobacillus sp. BM2]|uniref:prepilin-type N-terminal cleavage/methylation domain-containing protein n=1 Tax=Psychrobacillus sp. BM2 TaxID=3400421 RepID=UPI003B01B59B
MEGGSGVKKYINNEKGLTLVEMLAVIIIGAIIIVLVSNIHLFTQKQFKSQSEKTGQLYSVTYAAKVITKEIRKTDGSAIITNTTNNDKISITNEIEYSYDKVNKSIIAKNGTVLARNIKEFYVKKNGNEVILKIISVDNEKVNTKIILR